MLPYYFLPQNTPVQHNFLPVLHRFCTGFSPDFSQKSKKIWLFFAIFSLCVSIS